MKNEEKIGLSKLELGLSIAGIVLLSCLIILPPVFRIAFKEKKVVEDIPKDIDILTLICSKKNYYSGDVRKNTTYTIKYYKDKVRTYNIVTESIYSDPAPYDTQKQLEGKASTAYGMVEGINYTVNPSDKDLKITVIEDCDLSTFKSTPVIVPGDAVETKINSVYTTKDSVEQIKTDLQDEGYTCNQ